MTDDGRPLPGCLTFHRGTTFRPNRQHLECRGAVANAVFERLFHFEACVVVLHGMSR